MALTSIFSVELPGIEPNALPDNLASELPVRRISAQLRPLVTWFSGLDGFKTRTGNFSQPSSPGLPPPGNPRRLATVTATTLVHRTNNAGTPTEQAAAPATLTAQNHQVEESHDDVVHHVPGIDCFARPARGSLIGVEYTSQIPRQRRWRRMIEDNAGR